MATVRFVEIDGRRHELAQDAVQYETRCDGCGEFISDPAKVSFSGTVFAFGYSPEQLNFEGHRDHMAAYLAKRVAELAELPF